jgi:hypothetical protein
MKLAGGPRRGSRGKRKNASQPSGRPSGLPLQERISCGEGVLLTAVIVPGHEEYRGMGDSKKSEMVGLGRS